VLFRSVRAPGPQPARRPDEQYSFFSPADVELDDRLSDFVEFDIGRGKERILLVRAPGRLRRDGVADLNTGQRPAVRTGRLPQLPLRFRQRDP